jgi:arylsulfatase A-like enzyme
MAVFAALSVSLAACTGGAGSARPPDAGPDPSGLRPNILVFITDDQRWDEDLKAMPQTRRLFAEGGVRFAQGFAPTPLCCPARASIYTGRYTHNHGVRKNRDSVLLDPKSTLQYYLHRAGYKTALAGKYLTNWPIHDEPPFFDRFAMTQGGYYGSRFNVGGRVRKVARYNSDYLGNRAVRFLEGFDREDDSPWLLYVATSAAHEPFEPNRTYAEAATPPVPSNASLGEEDTSDKPPEISRQRADLSGEREHVFDQQHRTLMSVDDMVAKVYEAISRLGERDTLAFFLSDNGFLLGEHGLYAKRLPYDEAMRVPMYMRWPGVVEAGTDVRLVTNADIAPTVMQAAGLETPAGNQMDGHSLFDQGYARDRVLIQQWENWKKGFPSWAGIRATDYQYVEYYGRDESTVVFREYYDLGDDPAMLENLLADGSSDNDPDVRTLSKRLALDKRCRGTSCP